MWALARSADSAPRGARSASLSLCVGPPRRVSRTDPVAGLPQHTEWRHATEAAEVHGVKREGSRHPVPENPMRHHMSAKEYKAVTSL